MDPKKLAEPGTATELLRFWLLHAHKGRDRHDLAARRFAGRRRWLGVSAIVLAVVVGSSVFTSVGQQPSVWMQVTTGLLSILASLLAALQTFLDYEGRSQRHQLAASKYKAIIRELEEALSTPDQQIAVDRQWLDSLRNRLDTVESDMPVVDPGIYDDVERTYRNVTFVQDAVALYR
jgi:hypothetical protein